jgi:hypothetical protein
MMSEPHPVIACLKAEANVRFWHKADIEVGAGYVCSLG